MKRFACLILCIILLSGLFGCGQSETQSQIIATTKPVYEFTTALCQGTDLTVTQLITENVSCLHDYTLQVRQMRTLESAETVVLSGAGLEDFLEKDLLNNKNVIDASLNIQRICGEDAHHGEHHHEEDTHIWLSPANASIMAENIFQELSEIYPENAVILRNNLQILQNRFEELSDYGETELQNLSCRKIITFHDGFSYLADAFDLEIVHAIEEESGSEASASELIELTKIVKEHSLPAIFTETNGSVSAAEIIGAETGARIYTLDMAMSERTYLDAIKHNIDTLKEALE